MPPSQDHLPATPFDAVAAPLWAGQTAGGVREILTVAEIMRQLVDQTETALARAPGLR